MTSVSTVALVLSLASGAPGAPEWVEAWLAWPVAADTDEGALQAGLRASPVADNAGATALVIHVVDADSGKPVKGALVADAQERHVAFSDAKGNAKPPLWMSDGKDATVTAYAPGYRAGSARAPVKDGAIFVALKKETAARIQGVVMQADARLPAKDARVGALPVPVPAATTRAESVTFGGVAHALLAVTRAGSGSVATSTDGQFTLVVPKGVVAIVASVPNLGYAEEPMRGPTETVKLRLAPEGGIEVSGTVVDKSGAPLRDIEVKDAYSDARVVTGADGKFHFNRCAPGLFHFDIAGAESIVTGAPAYAGKDLSRLTVVVDPERRASERAKRAR